MRSSWLRSTEWASTRGTTLRSTERASSLSLSLRSAELVHAALRNTEWASSWSCLRLSKWASLGMRLSEWALLGLRLRLSELIPLSLRLSKSVELGLSKPVLLHTRSLLLLAKLVRLSLLLAKWLSLLSRSTRDLLCLSTALDRVGFGSPRIILLRRLRSHTVLWLSELIHLWRSTLSCLHMICYVASPVRILSRSSTGLLSLSWLSESRFCHTWLLTESRLLSSRLAKSRSLLCLRRRSTLWDAGPLSVRAPLLRGLLLWPTELLGRHLGSALLLNLPIGLAVRRGLSLSRLSAHRSLLLLRRTTISTRLWSAEALLTLLHLGLAVGRSTAESAWSTSVVLLAGNISNGLHMRP